MNKQIATISLLFLIVLTGCKKPNQQSEPPPKFSGEPPSATGAQI